LFVYGCTFCIADGDLVGCSFRWHVQLVTDMFQAGCTRIAVLALTAANITHGVPWWTVLVTMSAFCSVTDGDSQPFCPVSSSLRAPGFSYDLWSGAELQVFALWCRLFSKLLFRISGGRFPGSMPGVVSENVAFVLLWLYRNGKACVFCVNRYGVFWMKYKYEKMFSLPLMLSTLFHYSLTIITVIFMFCWPRVILYQCNETNVMHFSFNLLRIKGL
jgi:hypothetical protein